MRVRTYSTPFQIHTFWRNSPFLEKFTLFSKTHVFSKDDVIEKFTLFSNSRFFQKHTFFPKMTSLRNSRFFQIHAFCQKLVHFISTCFSRHCLSLRVTSTRCLWKTIENILRSVLCFRIMYYNLYLNIYNFPNILYPINTSCNTIILYKSNNTTSPFLSYIE